MHSYKEYREIIEEHCTELIPQLEAPSSILEESMKYSLSIGGKRLRPVLLLAACEAAGGSIETALPFALAVEYIHTYSLIHDDLPAMDNDDMRRGKPSNHKVYGEDIAVLAGDGLLNTAAELLTGEILRYSDSAELMTRAAKAAHEILQRAGVRGMIGGQTADVTSSNDIAAPYLISFIEKHKTADLIIAPVRAGLHLAGADHDMLTDMTEYAERLGTAFQILDDILDIEGDAEELGKKVGKDSELGKCNYAYVNGLKEAHSELHRLTEEAKTYAGVCGTNALFFKELADMLETRRA